jgi:hypothetical protein
MAADNVISIEEKPSLRDTWDQIKEEFKTYQAQATKYGVSITALQNAYNTLDTFLTSTVKISQDEDTKLSVAQKTEYNQDFANYYSERTTFANVIAQKIADGAVGNIQFGMVNLLKGSNVELGLQGYSIGRYFYDTTPEVGKTYTLVLCYSLGENNTYMAAYQDGGNYGSGGLFDKKGERVIQSHTFKFTCPNSPLAMYFFQFPNGTYGSKVHWAVLVEGNKGPSGWVPALSEQGEEAAKEAVDSMKITSRNLWILKNVCSYASSNVHPDRKPFTIDNYKIIVDKNPADLIGCNIKAPGSKVVVSGKTNLEKITPYYTCRDSNGSVIKSQTSMNIAVSDGRFEFSINNIPANTSVMALGLGYYPFASAYWLDEVSVVSGDKSVGFTPAPEDVQKEIDDVSNAVTNLNTTINGAFKDGIISEAEAKAIASNISILNAEKADIDNAYTPLYNSPYLLSGTTAATNLSSAKTAYNTAHSALITEINKAIADGKTTPEEKANVDTKFTAYNLALGTYKKRVEEANKAIQDQVKALAEQDATNKVNNIQVGGTNLFPMSKLNNVGCRGNSSKEGNGTEIIFKCNNPSTWAILPVSIPTALVPVNTDFVISMDIRNTNGFGYEVTATSSTPTLISIVKFENTTNEWKRVYKVFNSGNKANIGGINLWGVGDVRHIKIEIGNKATDWSPAPEDVDQAIQDAIAKTIDITAPSQVFKYGAGYTGTPTPSSIVLTAIPKNFTPTSYQWQYLNGSTWTNISGATSSTYSVAPGNTTLFPSGTNVRTFRCVCNGDEKLSDIFTLAKLADGATGSPGEDGKDAYTILLTNEAHAFAGSTDAALAGSTTCGVIAYKGTGQVAVTIGTITGLPAGMTASIANNGTTTPVITFTVTTSMKTASGTVSIPVTVDGKSFTRVFSYSIAFKGAAGENYWKTDVWLDASSYDADKWIPFTGTALQKMGYNRIRVSVALNSGTKPAWSTHASGFSVDFDFDMQASGWGTTDAQTLIYTDTFKFCPESPASCGQMTYSSIPVLYLRGGGKYHVKTDFPVTWTPRPDGYTWTSGSYTQSVSPQTSRPKPVGTSIVGRGVRSVANKYAVSSSNTTAPTSWSDTVPSTTTVNKYLWNYEIITYTDGTTAETNKRVIGVHGATGATGVGIKSITEYYLASASASGVTTSTSGWTTGMQVTTTTKKYLWNYEVVTYTDNNKYTSTPVIIGTHGATGDKGEPGAAGKGVKSTAIAYQASTLGTTVPTGTWSSSIPAVAAGQYLWTRTIITYTDNTTSTMYSVGRMGTNGTNGNAGNGVSSTTITYQASTSGTTAPTGTWSSSIPSVAAGSYLWTRTIISYTNGTTSTIYSVGKMGNTGAQGQPGESINGKMLYKDPEFKLGWNGISKYSNSAADVKAKLVVERIVKPSDAPTQSGYCLKVTCKATQSPGYGGGVQSITSRANAVFIQKIIAKIPEGYNIHTASNSMGTGYSDTWLTSTAGTGKYTTYLRKVVCGATGNFSSGGHVYITGNPTPTESAPLEWYIAFMTCYDQTADGYSDIEIVTKDSFATQMGYTSFQDMIDQTVAKGGKLIVDGLLNAKLIDVNTLAANNAFIDKLRTNILKANVITANMLSVAGFTFQDYQIYGGKNFGDGGGVKITATSGEKSFKAYKDASNYISMYYNSDSDWGLKGVVGGTELLKLGITNKIGPFTIEGSWLRGSNLALSGSQLNFSYSGHQVYVGSHPDMSTAGNAKLGTFMLSGGGYGGLGRDKQVALIAGAPNNGNSYAMAVTQGMFKMFPNAHIVSGVSRAYMTGTNPGITLGNEHPNIICLYGTGNRKKVNLYAGMEIGSHFFITSEASQGFDVLCTGSEKFYRNGNTYVAVQSSGQDTVLVMKVDTYRWTACQLPINWLGTWNP